MAAVGDVYGLAGRVDSNGGSAVDAIGALFREGGEGLNRLQSPVCLVEAVDGDVGGLLGVGVHDVEVGVEGEVAGAVSGRGFEPGWVAWSEPAGGLVELEAIDGVSGSNVRDMDEAVGVVGGDVVGVEVGQLLV